jgi:LacI family transcriptional regulator
MSVVTIKDVAARAGVSPKTVSRVINGEVHVRTAVRDAVMKVVTELDYRPNAHARSLSSSRSFLIALFFDDPASGYAADVQLGAIGRCRHHGHHLVVERIDRASPNWLPDVDAIIMSLRPAGIVLTPPLCDWTELTDLLLLRKVPFVRIAPGSDAVPAAAVMIDDFGAAVDMTELLIGLGHRDIAFVEGIQSHGAAGRRLAGYRDAMRRAGCSIRDDWIQAGDFTFRAGLAAGEALLSLPARPSAIFAANDELALGVLVSALRMNVAVPSELSVAGFDNAPISRMAWPQLTTVQQPNKEMAAAAIDILVDPRYENLPPQNLSQRMTYELITRESTGPCSDR